MSSSNKSQIEEQDDNTAKLVMNTFYKVSDENGATSAEITKYLQDKFGDVWKVNVLMGKAEDTLKRSVQLGFLDQRGDRYVSKLAREVRCGRKRRRKSCPRRRRPRCCCRPKKRRRPCCCK